MKVRGNVSITMLFGLLVAGQLFVSCGRDEKNNETSSQLQPDEIPEGEPEPIEPGGETENPQYAAPPGNQGSARLRGYEGINSVLQDRLIEPGSEFFLAQYLGAFDPDFPGDLARLLGFRFSDGLTMKFQSGRPNPVNLLVWHMALGGFAADVAATCGDAEVPNPMAPTLNGQFTATIQDLCHWPEARGRSASTLRALWLSFMSFDAPAVEYEAFETFFLGDHFASSSGQEIVMATITAMSLNPHFLLKK